MNVLKLNTPAPAFSLPDQNGKKHSLADYKGKWVVLYFYPKAMTPGCTVQACSIRDMRKEFEKAGAVVLGISPDPVKDLKKFEDKESLNFTLLGEAKEMAETYGAWQKKTMYGKEYMGMVRMTVIVSPKGDVAHIIPKADPKTHADEVLSFIEKQGK